MNEILKGIFDIKVPLFGNPLKELNVYLIKGTGTGRNLLIDTGFNDSRSEAVLLSAIAESGCALVDTDIFITHLHADHSGLLGAVKIPKNKAYASKTDGDFINNVISMDAGSVSAKRSAYMGFFEEDILASHGMSVIADRCMTRVEFTFVKEGDVLEYGDYHLEVQDFTGHTPGQLGLYDKKHEILFSADHILARITPNIVYWNDELDALGMYLKNLKKAERLAVKHTLPAHRMLIPDHKLRVAELLAHHAKRLDETRFILGQGDFSPYDVAMKMHWDFGGGKFAAFPVTQKWFAAGEAFSHLEHLRHIGEAKRSLENEKYIYRSL